jgi:hypothetical protein
MHWMSVKLADHFQIREHSWPCLFHISQDNLKFLWHLVSIRFLSELVLFANTWFRPGLYWGSRCSFCPIVLTFSVPCCDARYDLRVREWCSVRLNSGLLWRGFIFIICIHLRIYCCIVRFPNQMIFILFNSNTMVP